jgi:L-threonylcarbamoyladenylate synthase
MALAYLDKPPNIVRRLMDQYWPGALTIVAPAKKKLVYSPIRGDGDSLGVRLPNHDVPQGIAAAIGVPILGPSANFHGHETPYRIEHVDERLVRQVDLVIPGICHVGNVSTVVDCTHTPFRILRQGAISL